MLSVLRVVLTRWSCLEKWSRAREKPTIWRWGFAPNSSHFHFWGVSFRSLLTKIEADCPAELIKIVGLWHASTIYEVGVWPSHRYRTHMQCRHFFQCNICGGLWVEYVIIPFSVESCERYSIQSVGIWCLWWCCTYYRSYRRVWYVLPVCTASTTTWASPKPHNESSRHSLRTQSSWATKSMPFEFSNQPTGRNPGKEHVSRSSLYVRKRSQISLRWKQINSWGAF